MPSRKDDMAFFTTSCMSPSKTDCRQSEGECWLNSESECCDGAGPIGPQTADGVESASSQGMSHMQPSSWKRQSKHSCSHAAKMVQSGKRCLDRLDQRLAELDQQLLALFKKIPQQSRSEGLDQQEQELSDNSKACIGLTPNHSLPLDNLRFTKILSREHRDRSSLQRIAAVQQHLRSRNSAVGAGEEKLPVLLGTPDRTPTGKALQANAAGVFEFGPTPRIESEAPASIMYDPAGISEFYDIYTGASMETETQRKSEDHVLAKAKLEAAAKQKEAAAAAAAATRSFNQTLSAGSHKRNRTAVVI